MKGRCVGVGVWGDLGWVELFAALCLVRRPCPLPFPLQVLISTGRDRGGALPPLPAFEEKRSLILLMAVGRLPLLLADLTALGYPEDVPVVIIERSTHPDERVTRAPLSRIAVEAARVGVASPAVIIVGRCNNVLEAPETGH